MWLNLEILILNEKSRRTPKIHFLWFLIYKILLNAKKCVAVAADYSLLGDGTTGRGKGRISKEKGNFVGWWEKFISLIAILVS